MDQSLFLAFIVGVGALTIGLIIYSAVKAEQARQARLLALQEMCHRLGFEWMHSEPREPYEGFWGSLLGASTGTISSEFDDFFSLFQQGHSRQLGPLMTGMRDDIQWFLFDYSYKITRSTGKSTTTTTYYYSVVIAKVPFSLPQLSLSQEHFLSSLGKLFSGGEMQVESEEFNKRYLIGTQDRQRASQILDPKVIEYLLELPAMSWEMVGPYLMLPTTGHINVETFEWNMSVVDYLISLIPDYYKKDNPPWN